MTLDRKLVKEACAELWNQYHNKIEELGYKMGKDSYLQGDLEGFQIIATISPKYNSEMFKKFREIIPDEFYYKKEKMSVIISPPLSELFFNSPIYNGPQ